MSNNRYAGALRKLESALAEAGWVISGDIRHDASLKVSPDGKTWVNIATGAMGVSNDIH